MLQYITSDGNNWNYLLDNDFTILNEMKENDFLYVVSLIGAKCIYDDMREKHEDCYIDVLFDYIYENIDNTTTLPKDVRTTFYTFFHYTIIIILAYCGDSRFKIDVQADNSIDDDQLFDTVKNNTIVSVDSKKIHYDYEGTEENYGEIHKVRYSNGTILIFITTENRIIFYRMMQQII